MNRRNETTALERSETRVLTPRVSIHETDEAVIVQAEMPGVTKENLTVTVEGDQLILRGRKEPVSYENATFLSRETRDGVYERSFTIGDTVDQGRISAKMEQGLLTVTLAKTEHAKPRQVEVQYA